MPPRPPAPTRDDDPVAAGERLQAATTPAERTRRGVWFTPPGVARALVGAALERWSGERPPATVLDPAVGAGAFLLAAADRLPHARLIGVDVDAASVGVARRALTSAGAGDVRVEQGDGLSPDVGPADLVVGNPPFLSQLRSATSRDADRRDRLRAWYGAAAVGYVDEAGLFLLAAARHLRTAAGVAVLIVPEALLATAAAAPLRRAISEVCDVELVWRDHDGTFPTVPTCAVALTDRRGGAGGVPVEPWAGMLATGVPTVDVRTDRSVGDIATATADFRDAYYLVAQHVGELARGMVDGVPIVPVGLIDPAHLRWGRAPVRFAKRRFTRPVARGLPESFLSTRLGPKVLVATQTRVLEALVDAAGDLLPTTPAITVRTDRPWHVGAALTSPVLSAVAARRHAGAGMGRGALKLSARQVLALPLPAEDGPAWEEAASAYAAAHEIDDPADRIALLHRCGRAMWAAYGLEEDPRATTWWLDRLPRR